MKTFGDLVEITQVENNSVFPVNDPEDTQTNKIKFANLKSQILNGLGTAAYKDTTNSYSSTGTDPITGTGVAAALATVGDNLGTAASKDYTDTYSSTGSDVTTGKAVAAALETLGTAATKNTTNTYNSTGTDPITGTGVAAALDTLGTAASKNATDTYSSTGSDVTTGKAVAAAISSIGLGTAATKDSTDTYSSTGEDLTTGKAVAAALATLGTAAGKSTTDSYDPTGTDPITGTGVAAALATLPTPVQFRGSLGSDGTITALPSASASNNGFAYKVITSGTYNTIDAKVGDMFISTGSTWVLIPSGDEPSGTVTSVGITNGSGISVSGGPITSSGTITVTHDNTSDQASVSNSGRTYIQSLTLDDMGHVTGISSATETVTDTWRGIQDNLTSDSTTDSLSAAQGKALKTLIDGKAASDHTHSTTLANGGTSTIDLTANTSYTLNAGGTSVVFKTPADTNTHRPIQVNGTEVLGNNTTALNLAAGSNISITNSSGTVTIASTVSVTPAAMGFGYATCSTAAATAAKTASITGYNLTTGGIVGIKFTYAVPANATLNITSKGAKAIYYQGTAIKADVIGAGATATMMYDGTRYQIIGLDCSEIDCGSDGEASG